MSDGSITIDTKLNDNGLEKGINKFKTSFSKLGSIASTALKGVTVAIGTVTTAFTGLVTASVNARGELEQQIGGVQTLFANELGDASETVIKNANKAYKTAGMSAIEYMSTATSFSASLLQSLGKDTAKAAEVTDMAIIDMSDNANKMGTSMELIQNAYQGFAKQNYTMLDNLKLGYGGTKTEMERLLKDAQKLTGIKYDINNLSDVYNAIHVVQQELGITGTTAKEASETLQGSFASMKSSWQNFLSGSGDLGQVVDTATDVVKNVIRIVKEAIPQIIENIVEFLPELLKLGQDILGQIINGIITYLPILMDSAGQILNSLIQGIINILPQLIPVALQVIKQFATAILNNLPQILEAGIQILVQLIEGLAQMLPDLIPVAINCIITLTETLLDNIDLIIDAGIELIIALIEGIFDALPDLIARLPELIIKIATKLIELIVVKIPQVAVKLVQSLINGLFSYWNKMLEKVKEFFKGTIFEGLINKVADMAKAGLNLIKGLWEGIKNAKDWLWGKIKEFCNGIVNSIKNFFGIHSPSTLFADEIGKNLGLGLGEGFDNSLSSVYRDMQKAVEHENAKLTSNLTSTHQIQVQNEDNRQAHLESIDDNKEIIINTTTNLDSKVIARETNKVNKRQKLQYGIS